MSALSNAIVHEAKIQVGSRTWMYSVEKDEFGANTNKCNKFVFDVLVAAGVVPPPTVPKYIFMSRPPTAGEWATANVQIRGWKVVNSPEPGDVIAEAHDYSDATGHVGIVVGDKQVVSAASPSGGEITLSDWGFRNDGHHPTFRRYTG